MRYSPSPLIIGRCLVEQIGENTEKPLFTPDADYPEQTHILLAGNLTITASSRNTLHPSVRLRCPSGVTHTLLSGSSGHQSAVQITALALDQSSPPSSPNPHLRLASFLSTGEFVIFMINHTNPSASSRKLTYIPTVRNSRTSPIIQTVYHHPLLITLSQSFSLSIYDLTGDNVIHNQTLKSFTSHPPSSLVLSMPSQTTYKLVLSYAIAVYPAHWSVGATELIISGASPEISQTNGTTPLSSDFSVTSTRTARAFEVPQGWIDERKLRGMREQWGRKVERVADVQTDGKWVILAPGESSRFPASIVPASSQVSSESDAPISSLAPVPSSSLHSPTYLQLYRLHLPSSSAPSAIPKLSFVRTLHGQTGCISALALADGRCVSLGVNGGIWVWDLEGGTGAEVAKPFVSPRWRNNEDEEQEEIWTGKGTVVFDERRIISAGAGGVQIRRFDV